MKRLILFLLFATVAVAQNVRIDGIAIGPKGTIPFASVAVCTQPAVTVTQPCSPLANLCSSLTDPTCTSPNPVTSDFLGNFFFYIKISQLPFTSQLFGPQVASPLTLPDQGSGVSSGGTASAAAPASAVQFNIGGVGGTLGGSGNFIWNNSTNVLTVTGQLVGNSYTIPGTAGNFNCQGGALTGGGGICLFINSLATSGTVNSQSLQFQSLSSGTPLTATFQEDTLGILNLTNSAGAFDGMTAGSFGIPSGGGNFFCHHGPISLGLGVCFFLDVNGTGPSVASELIQFESTSSGGADLLASINEDSLGDLVLQPSNATTLGTVKEPSLTFAQLPASPNGSTVYCSDCNVTCSAGSGTGKMCFRENGAWIPTGLSGTVPVTSGGTGNASIAKDQTFVATAANTLTPKTIPDCPTGASNALNFTQSTDAWGCTNIATLSNPMTTLGDIIYGGVAGPGNVTRLAGPTTPATPFILTSTPSGGLATAPFWNITGVAGRTVSGVSDTILGSDRSTWIDYTSASAVAVVLPQSGTGAGTASDFSKGFVYNFRAGNGVVTVTPTTSTINGLATLTAQNQDCFIYSDNTNYLANCFDNRGVHPIPLDTGAANAYVVGCPNVQTLVKGASCIFSAANPNTTASTINVSGTGVKNLTLPGAVALTAGAILGTPAPYPITYDGTEWVLLTNSLAPPSLPSAAEQGDVPVSTTAGTTYAAQVKAGIDIRDTSVAPIPGNDWCAAMNAAMVTATAKHTWVEAGNPGGFLTGSKVFCNSNPFAGISNPPYYHTGNYIIVTSVPWPTPSNPFQWFGDVPSISTGTVLQACNASGGTCGPSGYPLFPGTAANSHIVLGGPFTPTAYQTGTVTASYVVASVATGTGVYTGTFTGGGANAFAGFVVKITGFVTNPVNNGTFTITASTATTITTSNSGSISESASAFASTDHLIGSGTTFTSGMVDSTVCVGNPCAANAVFGRIKAFNSTTSLTLEQPTLGTAASAVAFTIVNTTASALIMDGMLATTFNDGTQASCFGHVFQNITLDTNGIAGAVGYFTPNCQERTKLDGVKFVYQANATSQNSATPFACAAFDRSFIYGDGTNPNSAVTHFELENLQCGPGDASTTTNSYGYIFEEQRYAVTAGVFAGIANDGSDVNNGVLDLGTVAGKNGNLLKACVWIDGARSANPFGHHTEWCTTGMEVGLNNPTSVHIQDVHGANTNTKLVWFHANALSSVAEQIESGVATTLIQDDATGGKTFTSTNCGSTFNTSCVVPYYAQPNGGAVTVGPLTGLSSTVDFSAENLFLLPLSNILTGDGSLESTATTADASYTVGKAACVTATNTVGNCPSVAATSGLIGILLAKNGSLPVWATTGTAVLNSNASTTFTAGDFVCTDASNAALFVDNGSTACPNPQRQVGIVKTTNTATSHTVALNFSATAGAGGGSGTVNSGTAGQMAFYASSTNAVSGTANATISNGALTLGQSGTAGSLTLNGATSGTTVLSASATGGTLNLGSTNATVTSAGALTVASCSGCGGASGVLTILAKSANYTTSSSDFNSSSTAPTEVLYTVSSATTVTHTLPNTVTTSGTYQLVRNDCASGWGLYVLPANSLTLDGDTTQIFLPPCNTITITSNGTNWISSLATIRTASIGGALLPELYNTGPLASANVFVTTTVETPYATQFVLTKPIKVSKITISVNTGVAACVTDAAIADQGGNIITHIASGLTCTGATNTPSNASPVITLAPGTYFAAGCANTNVTLLIDAIPLTKAVFQYQQAIAHTAGLAANLCTAGVFTNTALGTITNSTVPSSVPTFWVSP